jgi:hypothetical protein
MTVVSHRDILSADAILTNAPNTEMDSKNFFLGCLLVCDMKAIEKWCLHDATHRLPAQKYDSFIASRCRERKRITNGREERLTVSSERRGSRL